ncbi:hypothetical protein RJ640_007275, partial [Escallonia rubra]
YCRLIDLSICVSIDGRDLGESGGDSVGRPNRRCFGKNPNPRRSCEAGLNTSWRLVSRHNDLRLLAKLKLVLLDLDRVIDVDEDEESDTDEEETETSRSAIVASPLEWFRVAAVDVEEDEEDEGEKDKDNDLVEEIDDDNGDDEDVV